MKFSYSTTIISHSVITLLLMTFFAFSAHSQGTFSTYSRFGIGIPTQPGSVTHFGMGGLSTPMSDGSLVNLGNPGSYSFCGITTFQVNAKGSMMNSSTSGSTRAYQYGQVNELSMLFKKPGNRWAFAAGLSPYSSINYNLNSTQALNDSVTARYTYNGSGGLNKLTIGTSRLFTMYKTEVKAGGANGTDTTLKVPVHQLSVGVNGNFIFGTLQRENLTEFGSASYYNTKQISKLQNRGSTLDAGVLYKIRLKKVEEDLKIIGESNLYIGIDYNIEAKLHTTLDEEYTRYIYSGGVAASGGTTYSGETLNGKMTLPQRIAIGAAFRKSSKKWGRYTLGADYKQQDWGDYQLSFDSPFSQQSYLDKASTLSLGIEYEPSTARHNDFFHRLNYRLGIRQTDTHLNIQQTAIMQQAISAGLSIPVVRSLSRFHIGAEYCITGTHNNNLIQEEGFNFMVGFTLTPSERWFFQRKYD